MTEEQALALHENAQQLQAEGRHEAAAPLFAEAAAYFRAAGGPHSPDLANLLTDQTESFLALCRYAEADAASAEAHGIVEVIAPLLDPEDRAALLPRVYAARGATLRELGRYSEAAIPLLAAIREAEQAGGPDCAGLAAPLNHYGVLCKYWRRFEDGERAYRRALAILENAYGPESVETAPVLHNLGGLEHARGAFSAGEPLARRAYELRLAAYGPDDERTVSDAVAWGGLLDGLGRHSESILIYERALDFYERRYGPDHFEVAATLHNLGSAYASMGDRKRDAIRAMSRALAIKQRLFNSPDHPEVRLTRTALEALQSGN